MSTISAGTTSTTTLVATGDTTGSLVFKTNDTGSGGTTAMTIDASQNVGIGTTSPTTKAQVSTATGGSTSGLSVVASGNMLNIFGSSSTNAGVILDATNGTVGSATAVPTIFRYGGTESMRIDTSGNLLVNTTNNQPGGASYPGQVTIVSAGGSTKTGINIATTSSSASKMIEFQYTGYGAAGVITTTTSSTAYTTSSDYRLKENVQPMVGALQKIAQLKPCSYTWKFDGSVGEGFIAHELAEICPNAVVGVKDEVDENGKPIYQGIDTSFLVATLTAAIQEQQAIITQLTERISALEGK